MEIDCSDHSNWLFDYGLMEDISADVTTADFVPPPPATIGFNWSPINSSSITPSGEIECSFVEPEGLKVQVSRKRLKPESCNVFGTKACREKLRRDRLNERFLELGSILEPGRPPRTDKASILSDAVRMVTQLRSETQKLNESNLDLLEKIKELKAEKNELRDEKQRLKAEKERLEQQAKAMSAQPSFLLHPSAMGAAFASQGQAAGNKLMPFVGYPGVAMWQFMQPAVVDTSQDHVLRPPVAALPPVLSVSTGSGERSFNDTSSRTTDLMDLRGGRGSGIRGPTRRYASPSRYSGATAKSFRPTPPDANHSRLLSVDPNFRAASELKFRGSNLESTGFPKRRESLYVNSQVLDDGS